MNIQGNTDELKFESINDFKFALIYGREIEFEWNGVNYGAFHEGEDDKAFFLCEAHKDDKGVFFRTDDELLDFVINGKSLREFITEVTVWNRNI